MVGHAIHNDFQALKYFHPKDRTRDTSRIPMLNQRAGLPGRASISLKSLARHLLQKKIQVSTGNLEMGSSSWVCYESVRSAWSPISMGARCEMEMNLVHPVLPAVIKLGEPRTSQPDH